MRGALIALTVFEALLVVAVLAVYLIKITRSLRATVHYLGNVNFGVRAIEMQAAPIGPSVTRINQQLAEVDQALVRVADAARRAAGEG